MVQALRKACIDDKQCFTPAKLANTGIEMVAIVSGNGAGLVNTSAGTLGQDGIFGNAASGNTNEAAYVNVATGNFSLQTQDDFVASRGINLSLTRTYNSQGGFDSDNGANWLLGVRKQITGLTGTVNTAGSTVTRIDGDGSAALYRYDTVRRAYVTTDGGGAYQTMTYATATAQWTWRSDHNDLKGVYERYEGTSGLIKLVGDEIATRLTYYYDTNNQLTRIRDATGDDMMFDYVAGKVSKIRVIGAGTTSDQSRVSYDYDDQGRLKRVTVDLTPENKQDAKFYVTGYTYVGASDLVESVTQADGTSLFLTYEMIGGQNRVATITDALGRTTSFDYTIAGKTTVTDHLGARTTYAYDAQGQLLSVTMPSVRGVSQITQFRYDTAGNLIQMVDARGLLTDFGYDGNGNRILERDAAGNTIQRTYSSSNLLLSETRFVDVDPDGAGAGQPVNKLTTRYAYNTDNRLRFIIDPEGRVEELRYNSSSQLSLRLTYLDAPKLESSSFTFSTAKAWADSEAVKSSQTSRVEYTYDARGSLSTEKKYQLTYAADATPIPSDPVVAARYVYTLDGRLQSRYEAGDVPTVYSYDGLGRLLTAGTAGNIETHTYDDAGNRVVTTSSQNVTSTAIYDKAGQLATVIRADAAGAILGQTKYDYDAAGRLRMQTDPNGAYSFILYDEAGRKSADLSAGGTLVEYRYDANNQLVQTIAYATKVSSAPLLGADGKPLTLTLEQAGIRPASTSADRLEWRLYDSANRLSKTIDALGIVTDYSYDGASRLIEMTRHATPVDVAAFAASPVEVKAVAPVNDADTVTRHAYDKSGRLRFTLDGEGYLTEQRYDSAGLQITTIRYTQRATAQLEAGGDWAQAPIATSGADIVTIAGYNGAGLLSSETDGAGNLTSHIYNKNGLLVSSTRGNVVVTYGYDELGRRVRQVVGGSSAESGGNAAESITQFTYDKQGNQITVTDPNGAMDQFIYDANNRLIFSVDSLGIVSETRYDPNGNVLARIRYATAVDPTPSGSAAVLTAAEVHARLAGSPVYDTAEIRRYDGNGRLAWSVSGAGTVTEFRYDAVGNLLSQIVYTEALSDAHLAELAATPSLLPTPEGSASNTTLHVYDARGKLVFTIDPLGAVGEACYDADGNVVETVRYAKPISLGTDVNAVVVRSLLQPGPDDTHTFTRYDRLGRPVWTVDGTGAATQLHYSNGSLAGRIGYTQPLNAEAIHALSGNPAALPAPDGPNTVTSYIYDGAGRLVFTVDTLGHVDENRYNADGKIVESARYAAPFVQLLSRTGDPEIDKLSVASMRDMLASADVGTTHLSQRFDTQGRLIWSVDALGAATELRYDLNGNVIARIAYTEALSAVAQATMRDDPQALPQIGAWSGSSVTKYVYDSENRLVYTIDAMGGVTETRYDTNNRVSETVRFASTIAAPTAADTDSTTALTVALVGDILTRDAQRDIHQFQRHDKNGRLTWSVDGNGIATRIGYDGNGNVYSRVVFAEPLNTDVLKALAADPRVEPTVADNAAYSLSLFIYDADNRLVFSIDPAGAIVESLYDAKDQLIGTVRYANSVVSQPGLQMPALTPESVRSSLLRTNSALDARQIQRYDTGGRLIWSVNATGTATRIHYDTRGNVSSRIDYAEALSSEVLAELAANPDQAPAPDGATSVTRFSYDSEGRLVFSVDALGSVSETRYDRDGRVVETIGYVERIDPVFANSIEAINAALRKNSAQDVHVFQRYDLNGRLAWSVDATGAATLRRYDASGNLIARIAYMQPLDAATRAAMSKDAAFLPPEGVASHVTHFVYDEIGRERFVIDALGNTSETRYDPLGNVIETIRYATPVDLSRLVAGPTGLNIDTVRAQLSENPSRDAHRILRYDANGRVNWSVDATGAVTAFAYDANGNTIRRTDYTTALSAAATLALSAHPESLPSPAGTSNVTRYVYDGDSRLVYTIDAMGAVSENRYDNADKVVETVRYFKPIDATDVETVAHVLGKLTPNAADVHQFLRYDNSSRPVWSIDASGAVTALAYDARGNVISRTQFRDALGVDAMTLLAADPQRVPAPSGEHSITSYAYDVLGRLVYTVDPAGSVTENRYDALGRVSDTIRYAHPIDPMQEDLDQVQFVKDQLQPVPADRRQQYRYDLNGNLIWSIDALGAATEQVYDAFGNVERTVRYAGALQGSLADGAFPVAVSSAPAGGAYVLRSVLDRITSYVYDASGRVTSQTDGVDTPDATTQSWAYDSAGNAIRHTDGRGNTSWSAYDAENRLVRHVDALGYVTGRTYFTDGQPESETRYVNQVDTPAAANDAWAYDDASTPSGNPDSLKGDQTTSWTYDRAGRVSTVTDAMNGVTRHLYDGLGNRTDTTVAFGTTAAVTQHWTYDRASRVLTDTRAFDTDAATTVTYGYDAWGHQTSIIAGGHTTRQYFDATGRKVAVMDADGATTMTTYNAFGDIVRIEDARRNVGYFYTDALGRVTLQIDPEGAASETRYDLQGNATHTIRYAKKVQGAYDENNRPHVPETPGDQVQETIYDALGRKAEVRTLYEGTQFYTESFEYDRNGNVETMTSRNGAVTTYEYDKNNRLVRETLPVTSKDAEGNPLPVRNEREYDARGNVSKMIEAVGLPEQRTTIYEFDKLNRQVKEIGDAIVTFDPVTKGDVPVTPTKTRIYDLRGNLVEEVDVRGGRTLHYFDRNNREIGVIDPAGAYTRYSYDAAGLKSDQVVYGNAVVAAGGLLSNASAPVLVSAGTALPDSGAYVLLDPARDRTTSYSYDGAGRLTGTLIKSISTATFDSVTKKYAVAPADIRTESVYDATGNLVKSIDANGNVTRNYYNKAGQLMAQLDAMRYLTVYTRDAFGNVDTQTSYATRLDSNIVVDDSTKQEQLVMASSPDDRITKYTYDRMGRTLTEARLNVRFATIDANNRGAVLEATGAALTTYAYNGLSSVVRRTDANGAVTDWEYDKLGRTTRELQAEFVDYRGAKVRHTTDYEYDGLDNVQRQLVRGENDGTELDDRITLYRYGPGGHLIGQTDPELTALNYRIDAAGNITSKTLVGRLNADNVRVDDVTWYWYDALGRETRHIDKETGTVTETRYNAFGEISGKRTNPVNGNIAWAEFSEYDQAGRVWRSNVGDGITKVYVYDRNGNTTLKLDSPEIDLGGESTRDWTLKKFTEASGINVFFSTYDARNQLTATYQPEMLGGHDIITVVENLTQQNGTSFVGVGGGVSMSIAPGVSSATAPAMPTAPGAVTIERAQSLTMTLTDTYAAVTRYYGKPHFDRAEHTLSMNVPDTSAWGTGRVWIDVSLASTGPLMGYQGQFYLTPGAPSASFTFNEYIEKEGPDLPVRNRSFTYTIYKETDVGPVVLGTYTWNRLAPASGTTSVTSTIPTGLNTIQFSGQRTDATRLVLMTRPSGSTGGWTIHNVPQAVGGRFNFDWSSMARGGYEFRYVSFNANNDVINSQQGLMVLSDSSPSISQISHPMGGAGRAFVDANGAFVFNELGGKATSLVVRYRPVGTQNWITQELSPSVIGGATLPGWFSFVPSGLWGTYDFEVEAKNAEKITINKSSSTFTVGTPSSINEPAGVSVQTSPTARIDVTATALMDITATFSRYIQVDRKEVGGEPFHVARPTSNYLQLNLPDTSVWGTGEIRVEVTIVKSGYPGWDSYSGFNGSFVFPNGQTPVTMSMSESAEGSGGHEVVNYGYKIFKRTPTGEIEIARKDGISAQTTTSSGSSKNSVKVQSTTYSTVRAGENKLIFNVQPNAAPAARLVLVYRPAGTSNPWTIADLQPHKVNEAVIANRFSLDWTILAGRQYDYQFQALDAAGNVLNNGSGLIRLDGPPQVSPKPDSLVGGTGWVFTDSPGNLIFADQGANTASMSIRVRASGSDALWSERIPLNPAILANGVTPGWFWYAVPPGSAGPLEYVVEARNAAGQLIRKSAGRFTPGTTNVAPITEPVGYTEPPVVTRFNSQPASGTTMRLSYRLSGTGPFTQISLGRVGTGLFEWNTGSVFSSDTNNAKFDFSYEVVDANGVVVNKAHGEMILGASPRVVSHTNDTVSTLASFTLPSGNLVAETATIMDLKFRLTNTLGEYKNAQLIKGANGVFLWDASAEVNPGKSGSVDYSYTLRNGDTVLLAENGQPIEVKGTLFLGPTNGEAQLQTVVDGSVSSVTLISHKQTTNAFGEVDTETNARGYTTKVQYNTLGSMIAKEDPSVDVTLANGYQYAMSPRTTYYVDRAGNMLATRDANGNLLSQLLLGDGSYMGAEFHADGGKKVNAYDIFGDVRYSIDEIDQRTDYSYDKNGRLTLILRPLRLDGTRSEVRMTYDQAGNRITQAERATVSDSFEAFTTKTWYDSMGRVAKLMTPDGRSSTYSYIWDNAIKSTGGRVTGGWRQTITDPMGRTSVDEIDVYGRTTAHKDLGGHTFVYDFNYAGWLTGQSGSTGQNITYEYYANGYVKSIRDHALDSVSYYEYDAAGNRTYEAYSRNGQTEFLENAVIDYDAANRVTRIHDTHADISYEYDAVGNRRRVRSVYHDGVQGSMQTQDFWYDYDNMNRFTLTMGKLSSATGARAESASDTSVKIVLGTYGTEGVQVSYNKAGQRIQAVSARDRHREDYTYGVEGYLEDTYVNTNDSMRGALASKRVNDLLGRTTNYYEYDTKGDVSYERSTVYSAGGRQLSQAGTDGAVTYYYYNERLDNGNDSGAGLSSSGVGELALVSTVKEDGTRISNTTTYEYWDDAKQSHQTIRGETPYRPETAWLKGESSLSYDQNGHLSSAVDAGPDGEMGTTKLDKDNVTFNYITNAQGLVLRREQFTGDSVGKMHRYLYLNGAMVGDVGNDGDAHLDYAQSLGQAKQSREEMYKGWRPISSADFDQNYQPINRTYPAATGSSYTVKEGDSLYAIAGAVWGDVSMWYLIAEANGITAETALTPGQTLTIPNKVTNIHNNSGTSRPYDAGAIIGDVSPTLPEAPLPAPPSRAEGCGAVGMIIMVVIAVVVSLYAGPQIGAALYTGVTGTTATAATLTAVATGTASATVAATAAAAGITAVGATIGMAAGMAVGAALGSIASQLAGVAMGMQDKINWRSVGTSALTSGLTFGAGAGLSQLGANAVVKAIANNVIGQGVGKAMGTQKHFSWSSVAASAVNALAMSDIKEGIGKSDFAKDYPNYVELAQNTAGAVVSGVLNVVFNGGRISWATVAADTISGMIADSANTRENPVIKRKDVVPNVPVLRKEEVGEVPLFAVGIEDFNLAIARQELDAADLPLGSSHSASSDSYVNGTMEKWQTQAGSLDGREVLGINLNGTAYYAGEGGFPFYGLRNDTNYPVRFTPDWLSPVKGLSYTFDSAGTPFWRDNLTNKLMSVPAPYALPSRSDLDSQAFWSGVKDGVFGLPESMLDGIYDLAYGRVTIGGLVDGAVLNTPLGVFGAIVDRDYYTAGQRFVGAATGLATGYGAELSINAAVRGTVKARTWINAMTPDVSANPFFQELSTGSSIRTGLAPLAHLGDVYAVSNANGASSAASFTERSVFASYPERTTLQLNSVSEQVEFMSKHVPGVNQAQAALILENGFSRDTSVVLGGSRIRGNFNGPSDLDVGFGNLSERQAQRVIKSINEQGFDVPLEKLTIVPGKSTATIDRIISPEEFFQRSGVRAGGDLRAGQPFVPSGSITFTKDGRIVVIPPGKF